jgi:hypothetical protein
VARLLLEVADAGRRACTRIVPPGPDRAARDRFVILLLHPRLDGTARGGVEEGVTAVRCPAGLDAIGRASGIVDDHSSLVLRDQVIAAVQNEVAGLAPVEVQLVAVPAFPEPAEADHDFLPGVI